jgi:hypothetical protein
MFVDLFIQHAMRIRHIVIWPAPLYYIFPHYLIEGTIFEKKNEHKMYILISSTNFVRNVSYSKSN